MKIKKTGKEMSFFNLYWKNSILLSLPIRESLILKLSLFISLLCVSNGVNSQNTVQLHPVVGDTISNSEKVAFYLFPEIKDSCFIEGVIFYQDSAYKVNIIEKYKSVYELAIDSTLLHQYKQNIEKLTHYYSNLEVSDSLDLNHLLLTSSSPNQNAPEYRLNEEERKQLVKEARRYLRKEDKAEDLGIHGVDRDLYIQQASHSNIFKAKIKF